MANKTERGEEMIPLQEFARRVILLLGVIVAIYLLSFVNVCKP